MNKPLSILTGLFLLVNVCSAQSPATTTAPVQQAAPIPVQRVKPLVVQQVVPEGPVDNSLNGQYNALLKKTERWQQATVQAFHKNYMDTLNLERRKLREANAKLAEQNKTITDLQVSVTSKDQSLSKSQSMVNSVSFLGIPMAKGTYNVIMWGLVLILGGGLAAVIYLSASARREAAYRIKEHEDLTAEFAAYKVKANEKEKKLARELQTERNKLEELQGK